jgi:hypothetical protein
MKEEAPIALAIGVVHEIVKLNNKESQKCH